MKIKVVREQHEAVPSDSVLTNQWLTTTGDGTHKWMCEYEIDLEKMVEEILNKHADTFKKLAESEQKDKE